MHVKNKALSIVTLVLLLLSGFFLSQGIRHQDEEVRLMIQWEEEVIDNAVRDLQRYSFNNYRTRIRRLAEHRPDISKAFAEGDFESLLSLTGPIFRDLAQESESFHAWDFNLPDGTVFLRVQNPGLKGDNIGTTRPIVSQVHRDREQLVGFDVGKHGMIFWIAQPVMWEGEYVGAMEFGILTTLLLETLEERFGNGVAVIAKADEWHKASLMEKGYRFFGDNVLIASPGSPYERIPDDFIFALDCDKEVSLGGESHILHNCNVLLDFRGERVGNILVLQDISDMVSNKRRFVLMAVSLTAALLLLSLGVLYLSFGTLIDRLEAYAERNKAAKEEVEESRNRLEVRVRERTAELQEINEILERENRERAKVQAALRDSHERLLLILEGLDANVYVADMETYEVLFINKAAKDNFGDIVGRKCWETIQSGQSGPCSFCTNRQLVQGDGSPAGACSWEFQNVEQGKWYIIQDRAIRWVDGKVVRLAIATDITERKRIEERTRAALKEKEVLLKEIHHRVKNNMQIISSLLNLESVGAGEDKKEIFRDSQSRIRAMSLVHEKLYQTGDIMNIDLQEYIESMVNTIYALYGETKERIGTDVDAGGISLGIDTVILCGLIINELVTNSLRHAFPDGRRGRIGIAVSATGEGDGEEKTYELRVRDDGVGMPGEVDPGKAVTLGLQLVTMLAEHQLQGRVAVERDGGTGFSVTFRELKYGKRA